MLVCNVWYLYGSILECNCLYSFDYVCFAAALEEERTSPTQASAASATNNSSTNNNTNNNNNNNNSNNNNSAASGAAAAAAGGAAGGDGEKSDALTSKQRYQIKHRELFLSRQVESIPATQIRGKCSVTLLNETESLQSYLNKDVSWLETEWLN